MVQVRVQLHQHLLVFLRGCLQSNDGYHLDRTETNILSNGSQQAQQNQIILAKNLLRMVYITLAIQMFVPIQNDLINTALSNSLVNESTLIPCFPLLSLLRCSPKSDWEIFCRTLSVCLVAPEMYNINALCESCILTV